MLRWRLIACVVASGLLSCSGEQPVYGVRETVTIDDRKYDLLDVASLGPCVTVDDGTGHNAALTNVRAFLTNEQLHDSIPSATKNLNNCADAVTGGLVIVGHGSIGVAYVGGAGKRQRHKFIGSSTDEWEELMKELRPGTGTLSFLSCNTGADERGAKVLTRLAQVTQRRVQALTGLAYFKPDQILVASGTTWNDALPHRGAVVKTRPAPRYAPFKPVSVVTLGGSTFPLSAVKRFRIGSFAFASPEWLEGDPRTALLLPAAIDFEHPFRPPGPPLAAPTGEIVLETSRGYSRKLVIYGDTIVQDDADPKRFFDLDTGGFSAMLAQLR